MNLSLQKQSEIAKNNQSRRKAPKKPTKPVFPEGIIKRYSVMLLATNRKLRRITKEELEDLFKNDEKLNSERLNADLTETILLFFARILRRFEASPSKETKNSQIARNIVRPIGRQTNAFNFAQFSKETNRILGIDPVRSEPWLRTEMSLFTVDNVRLIDKMHVDYLNKVQGIVIDGYRSGRSTTSMSKEIAAESKVSDSRARLIARDQVSKLNGSLNQARALNNGVKKYIWHTNLDGRERSDHHALNDTEQTWAKAPVTVRSGKRSGERNHPGEDIQCRCWAENVYEGLLDL